MRFYNDNDKETVIKYLSKMSSNKARGADSISIKLLKIGMNELVPSIVKRINLSITTKEFPVEWKTTRVTVHFKSGDLADINNYRPISVLPVLSEIIERHIHDNLIQYLKDHNLIYPR